MLADRDAAITSFKKETYHIVRLDVGGAEAASARISDAAKAEAVKTACEASQAVCVSVRRERKTEQPPRLFDLTGLQREANRIYGYTAKQTLDLAQALYEKRLLTYPRTDSNYLTDDMGDTAVHIAALLVGKLPFMKGAAFTPDIARTLNSKKVSDHHAIIPTMELAKADLAALPESERNILTLAGARLLFAAAEPHIFDAVTAVFSCADTEFTAKGKTVLCDGWKELERRYRATLKGKPDAEDDEENELILDVPTYAEGQSFDSPAARVTAHDTQPPKPHTEASLLSAMERAGSADTDPDAERKGLAYAVELTGRERGKIRGNLYELDYAAHFRHVREQALPADTVTLFYERGERSQPTGKHFSGSPDPQYGAFLRFEVQPNAPEALRDILQEEKRSREQLSPGDFKAHIAALRDGLIEAEARRIAAEMKRQYSPNSPNKTHYMTELAPAFLMLASSRDVDRLFSLLPYKTLTFSKIEGRHGIYALIDKNENRDRDIRKPRPSIRAQLAADKKKAAPKRAAKTKHHEMEV